MRHTENSARILRCPYDYNYFSNRYKKLSESWSFVISQPMLHELVLALLLPSELPVCKQQNNMTQHWKWNHLMCKIEEYFTFFAYYQVPPSNIVLQHRVALTIILFSGEILDKNDKNTIYEHINGNAIFQKNSRVQPFWRSQKPRRNFGIVESGTS
jgi:hypothetical protein